MANASNNSSFDRFAGNYDTALAQGLSLCGEDKDYFAKKRIAWTRTLLARLAIAPGNAMDFGCGTASSTPFFLEWPNLRRLIGIDVSSASIIIAKRDHPSARVEFREMKNYQPSAALDLVYCNGVFHHIPVKDRPHAIQFIHDSLRPGGIFALWENNPWNPGTRLVMSRIPFDRDAITLTPPESRQLLRTAGFQILRTDYLFIFPRFLKWLRPMEQAAIKLPIGGQYLVLSQKPIS